MDRRGFLRLLAGAGVAAATNPVHFLAPIGGWKSDVIVNPNDGALTMAHWPPPGIEVGDMLIFDLDPRDMKNWYLPSDRDRRPLRLYDRNFRVKASSVTITDVEPETNTIWLSPAPAPAPPPYRVSFSGKLIGVDRKRVRRVFTI